MQKMGLLSSRGGCLRFTQARGGLRLCVDSRIARSKDLKSWLDSDIPVMIPDFTKEIYPRCPERMDLNAGDDPLLNF